MLFKPRFILVGWAALLPLPTFAATTPTGFDQWSVNNGSVVANVPGCGNTYNCALLTSGPGFVQQQITDTISRVSYIQTIVTNPLATGTPTIVPGGGGLPFSSESYVKTGVFDPSQNNSVSPTSQSPNAQAAVNGIASKQVLHAESTSAGATGVFDSYAEIRSGWALSADNPNNVDITQRVSQTSADGSQFSNTARIVGKNDDLGNQTGTSITLDALITQPGGTNSDGTSSGGSGWGGRSNSGGGSSGSAKPDVQVFTLRRVGGNMLATSGKATLASKTVTWKPGDVVQTVWFGQGFDFGSFGGSGLMGFQSYDNLSDAAAQISTSSTSSVGPFSWVDPPFGPKPVMPANGGSSGSSGGGFGGW